MLLEPLNGGLSTESTPWTRMNACRSPKPSQEQDEATIGSFQLPYRSRKGRGLMASDASIKDLAWRRCRHTSDSPIVHYHHHHAISVLILDGTPRITNKTPFSERSSPFCRCLHSWLLWVNRIHQAGKTLA